MFSIEFAGYRTFEIIVQLELIVFLYGLWNKYLEAFKKKQT